MDFLRIGENKLKITLTEEELLFYGMDLSALSYSSTETRRAFWAILDDAKHATGFDAAASRVSVQVFTSRTGGCEMYVIGGDTSPDSDAVQSTTVEESGLTVCPSLPKIYGKAIGEFTKLSDLLCACKALSVSGYDAESSAWQIKDHYYLYLVGNASGKAPHKESALTASGVLWEFASPAKELSLPYLAEHGSCLCPTDAVGQLSILAV